MIETIKDMDEKVLAYVEYNVLNKDDKVDDKGNYLCIANLWIHSSLRFKNIINYLINQIAKSPITKNIKYVCYRRKKYGKHKKIPVSKFLKYIK